MTQIDVKYFTPKEANKTLPLVKQIVRDILDCAVKIKIIAESLNGEIEDNSEIKYLSLQIQKYMGELEEIGCSYKDWSFDIGLVDFPSVINGKDVLLCWRSDENEIQYYHGLLDGYSGRRLIPQEYL